MWNFVSHIKGRTLINGVWKQDAVPKRKEGAGGWRKFYDEKLFTKYKEVEMGGTFPAFMELEI